jgi:hypothetical protein
MRALLVVGDDANDVPRAWCPEFPHVYHTLGTVYSELEQHDLSALRNGSIASANFPKMSVGLSSPNFHSALRSFCNGQSWLGLRTDESWLCANSRGRVIGNLIHLDGNGMEGPSAEWVYEVQSLRCEMLNIDQATNHLPSSESNWSS